MIKKKAIFLDRDGTINVDTNYTHKVEDLQFEKNAIAGLKMLSGTDYLLIITTGQSGIGRGYYSEDDYHKFMGNLAEVLKNESIRIDASYFCPHHPEKAKGDYKRDCRCRKPGIGMIEAAVKDFADKGIEIILEESVVIGDKTDDIRMGNNAGCLTVLVNTGKKGKDGNYESNPSYNAEDLKDAARWIICRDR